MFSIHVSNGMSVFMDSKKTGDVYKNVAVDSGEHVFCLDNSFSQISTKTVYFELYVKDMTAAAANSLSDISASPELLQFEVSLENFKNATDSVENNLQRSIQIQRQFASVELRDRSIQEYNFERVNFWSGVQLFIMVSVSIANVLMIRGLFDDRRRVKPSGGTRLQT
jgi:protein ERP2